MSIKKQVKYRKRAFQNQSGLCYYCGFPMWENHPENFAYQYNLSLAQAKRLQCTAEHLRARQDGGKDNLSNIVAACLHCNQTRHRRRKAYSPLALRSIIAKRLAHKAWHDINIIRSLLIKKD